jgi:hypothetical protein
MPADVRVNGCRAAAQSPVLDRWERRLQNWALWCVSGSHRPRSAGVSSAYSSTHWRDDQLSPPPPLVGEALDTDRLVHRLPHHLLGACVASYIWTGTLADRARSLGCHVNTMRNRTTQAMYRLDDLWVASTRRRA